MPELERFLVTGCAGFVGSELCRQLLAKGNFVTGFDNLSRGTYAHMTDLLANRNFHFIKGDIGVHLDIRAAFENNPQGVFHLAALHYIPECIARPADTYEINVVGTMRIWETACQFKVAKFLFVSTGDVYRPASTPHRENDITDPFNAYGLSKFTAERALTLQRDLRSPELIIARLFNVYGPGETNPHLLPELLMQVRNGLRELHVGNLWPVRDFIFVSDAASAFVRLMNAATNPGVVNVGTGGGWSVSEIIGLISSAAGRDITAISVPERCRPIERDTLRPNIERLVESTGWKPSRSFIDGLRETLAV